MALNRINHAGVAQQRGLERFQEAQRRDEARQQERRPASAPTARPEAVDRAEISDNARRLMEIHHAVTAGREALQDVPDVRDAKVDEARQRLARGYYHSAEVTNDVAERVGRTLDALDEL